MRLNEIVKTFNLDIRGVIHIGAHWGEEYIDYEKQGIKNLLFFEPVQANYLELLKTLPAKDEIQIENIALGNKSGMIEMFVETANGGQSCSVLEPIKHLSQYPSITFPYKEIVKIEKLDNVEFNRSFFNMINIDVQGYELEVFKGAVDTLKGIDIIYTEVNRDEVYKDCARVEQLDEFLSEFKRVKTEWTGETWGDAIYLR